MDRNSSIYKYIGANSIVHGMLVKSVVVCKTRWGLQLTKVLCQSVEFGRTGRVILKFEFVIRTRISHLDGLLIKNLTYFLGRRVQFPP